jgi:hypothetical protein
MSEYQQHLKIALFHVKECARCIRKALGDDYGDDDPLDDVEDDYPPDPDPLLPAGRPADNPQRSRRAAYLRLIG